MTYRLSLFPSALLMAVSAGLCGCGGPEGPQRVDLHGTVSFDGRAVPKGRILFEPDASAGNSGPQGFADIEQGSYDTRRGGRGAVSGPQVVTVTGFDGVAIDATDEDEGSPLGSPLFDAWQTSFDIPATGPVEADFEVPTDG